jgi:glycerol-3-phosphate dehydrogenase
MQATLCPHSEHLVAEAVEAVRAEAAVTLADILLRRVPVALGGCWSEECAAVAAERIGAALRWSTRRVGQELESFSAERAAFLQKPQASKPLPSPTESLA